MHFQFKPTLDPGKLTWSLPDSRIAPLCSYCSGGVPAVPLMMWDTHGACIQFCDACVRKHLEVSHDDH